MDAFVGKNEPSLFMESTTYMDNHLMSNQQLAVKKNKVLQRPQKKTCTIAKNSERYG
jgi:hypothetical protein